MEKKTIPVIGMACAGCAANVEKRLRQLEGIASANVNFAARTALVEYDPKVITPQTMKEEIAKAGLDREIGQYFAALTNMRSVGVMGDERTYDYAIALRAVNTIDFMTAEAAQIPYEVLNKVMSRIINEVRGVNRVMYDLTSKPPGTIEFE